VDRGGADRRDSARLPGANWWVGSGSTKRLEEVARTRCAQEGLPIDQMLESSSEMDNGVLGFRGRAVLIFHADGRLVLRDKMTPLEVRVELRRRMNLMDSEVVSISHSP
jgi:hypothetical protein